jgi:Tfp pilus assembly protein FimT
MTFMELLIVLCLTAILMMFALPTARSGMDVVRVRAAREAAFGMATRTRSVALARGGADIVFDIDRRTAEIIASDGVVVTTASFADYDVAIASDDASRVMLRYDARGIGRMASRTVHFVRGNARAGLTFSSYGRVRRW